LQLKWWDNVVIVYYLYLIGQSILIKSAPLISLITLTKDSDATLAWALESVERQTFSGFEHIIRDECSGDTTPDLIDGYVERMSHLGRTVKVFRENDGSLYRALNRAIDCASGRYIAVLHSDDFFARDDVLQDVATVLNRERVDMLYGDLAYVDRLDTGKVRRYWRAGRFKKSGLLLGWMPPHPTVFLSRQQYDRAGPYATALSIAADYEFLIRVMKELPEGRVAYLPRLLTCMRTGGVSNLKTSAGAIFLQDYQALRVNGYGLLQSLVAVVLKKLRKLTQYRSEF